MFFYFSDTLKKDRRITSLSNMMHNSITIQSHTRLRSDGKIESYCGLKLTEIITQEGGKHKQIYIFIQLLINTIMLKNETIFTKSSKIQGITGNLLNKKKQFLLPTCLKIPAKDIKILISSYHQQPNK